MRIRAGLIALALAMVFLGTFFAAVAQTESQRRTQPHGRSTATPPPLPVLVETPLPGLATAIPRALPPLPRFPGLTGRRVKSASGGTVCITLAGGTSCSPSSGSQLFPLNSSISWQTSSLPGTSHDDYVLAPDQTTPVKLTASPYTTAAGASHSQSLTKAGVYIFAALNTANNDWDAVVYAVSGSEAAFKTYSDSNLTVESTNFTPGAAIYMSASALTPTDQYVYAVEYTSTTGACVFTAPASVPTSTLCNVGAIAGFNAPGGTYTATWNTPGTLAKGTYSISLYDRTTNARIAQRQIAVTGGATVSLSATTNFGTISPMTKVAFNGNTPYADSGAGYSMNVYATASGLPLLHTINFVVSDPNGTVVGNTNNYSGASGSISNQNIFTLNTEQSPRYFGPNVYTLTLADATTSNNPPTVVGSAAFQVVGYTTLTTFTNGSVAIQTTGSPTATAQSGIVYQNDGEVHFGVGNADAIAKFVSTSTGVTKFPNVAWASGGTSCGTNCARQVVTDSTGQTWNVDLSCVGSGCGAYNNANRTYTLTSTPVTAGYGLPPNATLTTPDLLVTDTSGNACSSGCTFATQIQPLHGNGLSTNGGGSNVVNDVNILSNAGVTYNLVAALTVWGTRVGTTTQPNRLVQGATQATGYQPRYASAVYAAGSPMATGVSGIKQILALQLNDNTASGSTGQVYDLALTFPSSYNTASMSVDSALNSNWVQVTCSAPAPTTAFCLAPNGINFTATGFSYGIHSDTIYLDVDPPTTSFAPSGVGITVYNPTPTYGANNNGTPTAVEAGTPATVTSLQLQSYSLLSSLMTAAVTPSTLGQGATGNPRVQNATIQFQNTPSSADPNPDEIDAVVVQVDPQSGTTVAFPGSYTVSPGGWSYLGSSGGGAAATSYWFGLCPSQLVAASAPTTSAPWGDAIPACSAAVESANALGASGQLNIGAALSIQAGTGTVTGRIYAHGANGGGWSSGTAFTITITNADAASAGFTTVNGVPVGSGSQPMVSGDPSTTLGSSFGYTITNTGSTTITTATIKVPGPDISGASDQESTSTPYFNIVSTSGQVTSGLTYTGGASGCTATVTQTSIASTGPVVITPGKIALTGCSIPAGGSVTVNFNAKSPSTVNSTYQFTTTFNAGNTTANEAWFAATQLKIGLGATLTVVMDPQSGSTPGGSTPVADPKCSYSAGPFTGAITSYLNFGTVTPGQTVTCNDAVLISVATNAGGTVGWQLYVNADGNPSNEVLILTDSANSNGTAPVTYSTTTYTALSTGSGSAGNLLASRASGNAATRTPYDVLTSYKVTPVTGDTSGHTQYLTITFIAN